MFTSIIAFLGGSAFRMLWGEISSWVDKARDHKYEMERMRLQADLDERQHERNQIAIRTQHEMGIQLVRVQSESNIAGIEAEGWLDAVRATGRSVGIAWVDAWNAMIRPAVASWSVGMLTLHEFGAFAMSESTSSVCFVALGLYLADRTLNKRGK